MTYLGPEAVSYSTDLCDSVLLLQCLDAVHHDRVNESLGVRVLAVGPLLEPLHEVESLRAVEGDGIAIEHVEKQRQITIGGKLVGDELAVLPNADDVRDEQDADALVRLVGGRGCEVGVVLVGDADQLAGGCATEDTLLAMMLQASVLDVGRPILMLDADSAASCGGVGGHDGVWWRRAGWTDSTKC